MNTDIFPETNITSTRTTKKGNFWGALESMSTGAGLMADWEWALGAALAMLTPFLKPTEKQSESFPCPARPPCECRHEVQETDFGLVAICMCGSGECEPFRIEPKDVLVYSLDMSRLGHEISRSVGFSESNGAAYSSLGLREIGVYAAVAAPVYLSPARSGPFPPSFPLVTLEPGEAESPGCSRSTHSRFASFRTTRVRTMRSPTCSTSQFKISSGCQNVIHGLPDSASTSMSVPPRPTESASLTTRLA